ncbi:hypothetical protein ACC848_40955, partial [Rhizobium johnstonii]
MSPLPAPGAPLPHYVSTSPFDPQATESMTAAQSRIHLALQTDAGIEEAERDVGDQHADEVEEGQEHQEGAGEVHVLALQRL